LSEKGRRTKAADARYERLSAADRRAVLEILRETMPALPAYYADGRPASRG